MAPFFYKERIASSGTSPGVQLSLAGAASARHLTCSHAGRLHAQRRVGELVAGMYDPLPGNCGYLGNHSCAWYSGHYAFCQHFHIQTRT